MLPPASFVRPFLLGTIWTLFSGRLSKMSISRDPQDFWNHREGHLFKHFWKNHVTFKTITLRSLPRAVSQGYWSTSEPECDRTRDGTWIWLYPSAVPQIFFLWKIVSYSGQNHPARYQLSTPSGALFTTHPLFVCFKFFPEFQNFPVNLTEGCN